MFLKACLHLHILSQFLWECCHAQLAPVKLQLRAQKVKRGVGWKKWGGGGGSASFDPCKGVGHPIFQPVSGGVGHDSF